MSESLDQFQQRMRAWAKVPIGSDLVVTFDDMDLAIENALTTYSDIAPRYRTIQLPGDGPQYDLADLVPGWKEGWSVQEVMVDVAAAGLIAVDSNVWKTYVRGETLILHALVRSPWIGFHSPHVMCEHASGSSVPHRDLNALAKLAAAEAITIQAADSSDKTSSTINADSVNHSSEQEQLFKMADRLRGEFDTAMAARYGSGLAIAEHDLRMAYGPMMYHGDERF